MKKHPFKASLFLFFISISPLLFSQSVGFNSTGTAPSTNAVLDLNTGNTYNRGLIVPHIELGSSLSTFGLAGSATTKDTGMIVYNMNGISQPIGCYYWNGSTWVNMGAGSSGWQLTGNSGTTAGTNFIGTADGNSLIFKVNNTFSGIITSGGLENTGFGYNTLNSSVTGSNNCGFGAGNLSNISSGSNNTASGYQAAYSNTSGSDNTSIGYAALNGNNTGSQNTALGSNALTGNTNGLQSAAVGYYSLHGSSGSYNTAEGVGSGDANTTGTYNTFIGYNANTNAGTYTNSTAIGNGATITASNTIVLGNSSIKTVGLGAGAYTVPIQVSTATSGTVVANGSQLLELDGTATALSITMPSSPVNGQLFEITTSQTSISLTLSGSTLSPPATVTPSTPAKFYYSSNNSEWMNQ